MASTLLRSSKIGLALKVSNPALALPCGHREEQFRYGLLEAVGESIHEQDVRALFGLN
jgi:hypothetical protein